MMKHIICTSLFNILNPSMSTCFTYPNTLAKMSWFCSYYDHFVTSHHRLFPGRDKNFIMNKTDTENGKLMHLVENIFYSVHTVSNRNTVELGAVLSG